MLFQQWSCKSHARNNSSCPKRSHYLSLQAASSSLPGSPSPGWQRHHTLNHPAGKLISRWEGEEKPQEVELVEQELIGTMEGLWSIYLPSWSFVFPSHGNCDGYHSDVNV